jgi:hypothetical protein
MSFEPKHKGAREKALSTLMKMMDDEDMKGFPAGDQGDHNPLEKSGYEGDVTPKQSFAHGGEVGSGDHDETSGSDFAKAWEELKGSKMKRPGMDDEGLGGEDEDDGSGEDAASDSGELSDDEKDELKAAYEKHILGKR